MLTQIRSLLQSKAAQSVAAKREGDAHLKAGRLEKAVEAYGQALSLDERNVDAHVGLAYVHNERRNLASARQSLASALAIDADNADAHYMLATIARQDGDVKGALAHLERAIASRPDLEFAYIDMITLLAQAGDIGRAEQILEKALAACPGSAAIHNMRGRQLGLRREFAAAIPSFRKAVSLAPGTKEYHKSLGDALDDSGNGDEAIASFEKAIWLDPDYLEARVALARALQKTGRTDGAVAHYREVLARQPGFADGHVNLGVALQAQAKFDEAIACYRRAAELNPNLVSAHANLGSLLAARGDNEAAIACFEKAKQIDPSHPMAHYLLALKGGDAERAPSDYVEQLFDHYASNFDSHLVKGLKYTVPEKLAELLRPHAPADGADKWTVLDLGCGTGLAGVAVALFSRLLVGVDLSSKMLDKARERNLYERLEQGDLLKAMQGEASASYDLVLAADVFVYLGKLDELTEEAHRLLKPGGLFAFSVESLDALARDDAADAQSRDYRLNDTGRFAHSAGYLARLCARTGFEDAGLTGTESRQNRGAPVQGYLVLWRKHPTDRAAANVQAADGNSKGTA